MEEYGEVVGPQTVRLERILPGPVERVWEYLTDSEKRGKWLASGELEPRVGGRVELKFLHSSLSPHVEETPERFKKYECGVGFVGRVTRYEPPRLLSYTWAGEKEGEDSEVTFELSPQGEKVLLTITHVRLADPTTQADVASGWHAHTGILLDNLEGKTPRPFWSTWLALEQEYKKRILG
jgi:uncharacterized protein YndB with AHSA1/START domain